MSSVQRHREALQRRTQGDWAEREYVELISGSLKRLADFLNAFDMSVKGRMSNLNEKLTGLERKVTYLEAKVGLEDPDEVDEAHEEPGTESV
ncbi:hypothetical protein TCAL_03465 [Tigriopus californicus]|uniref:Protein BRICK1 n=2 Tax=Tigriopus californicus TaxID=6832 RepID=A0A553NQ70_TIGCA|nr:hypothetical protein TCAL_03465 [Tigriopus californicus]|eukprot:TCALIF_03465-PA protein Name:"Similar to brk1-a Probable protein BRICK1-A (Xenopus laevis)" AED:0.13 eAED:0.13 QI:0/-1/0/1/-1/1/1/0/91